MLVSVQCGPLRRIHGPAGADLSGNRCGSAAACQASPERLLPAPRFFLCQRMAHPPRPRPRLSRTGLPRPARALLWPPSASRPVCRGPAHVVRPFMCRFFRPHFCRLPSPSLGLVLAAAASCPCIRSCRPNCGLFLFRKNLPPRPACGPVQQAAGERAHASVPGAFHARNNIRCKRMGHVYAAGTIRRKW